MFAHEFMRNAFVAGTFVALACGLFGWFVVLRSQVFAGDALGHVAFTGALAAAAVGVDVRLGLFVVTFVVAGSMGLLGERARPDDVVIGSVFAWILGLGALFLSIFVAGSSAANGTAAVRVLFGSILGLSTLDTRVAIGLALLAVFLLLTMARPLLFSSLDPEVARGVGVPVRALGLAFIVLLGLVAAEGTQAVGALLVLGLLAAPGAAARLLTSRPWLGLGFSAAIAVGSTWIGLILSYEVDSLPAGTAILGVVALAFALAGALDALRRDGDRSRSLSTRSHSPG